MNASAPSVSLSHDDARSIVGKYIEHYNTVRLHSAIGYIAPADKLNGLDQVVFKERDRKLEAARELRKQKRQQARPGFNIAGDAHLLLTQAV